MVTPSVLVEAEFTSHVWCARDESSPCKAPRNCRLDPPCPLQFSNWDWSLAAWDPWPCCCPVNFVLVASTWEVQPLEILCWSCQDLEPLLSKGSLNQLQQKHQRYLLQASHRPPWTFSITAICVFGHPSLRHKFSNPCRYDKCWLHYSPLLLFLS